MYASSNDQFHVYTYSKTTKREESSICEESSEKKEKGAGKTGSDVAMEAGVGT
jgi:hypothetical protein